VDKSNGIVRGHEKECGTFFSAGSGRQPDEASGFRCADLGSIRALMVDSRMNRNLRNFTVWVVVALLLLSLLSWIQLKRTAEGAYIPYSRFLKEVDQGHIRDVVIQGSKIHGTFADSQQFRTYAPNDPTLVQRLYSKEITITAEPTDVPWVVSLGVSWLPFIALIGVWIFLSRQRQAARETKRPPDETDDSKD
jgi:ATP-dependent Zn protease